MATSRASSLFLGSSSVMRSISLRRSLGQSIMVRSFGTTPPKFPSEPQNTEFGKHMYEGISMKRRLWMCDDGGTYLLNRAPVGPVYQHAESLETGVERENTKKILDLEGKGGMSPPAKKPANTWEALGTRQEKAYWKKEEDRIKQAFESSDGGKELNIDFKGVDIEFYEKVKEKFNKEQKAAGLPTLDDMEATPALDDARSS